MQRSLTRWLHRNEIAPVWYMTPFYAMLRAIPNKFMGLVVMAAAIAILFVLPWLDRSRVRSIRYKETYSIIAIVVFVIKLYGAWLSLSCGSIAVTHSNVTAADIGFTLASSCSCHVLQEWKLPTSTRTGYRIMMKRCLLAIVALMISSQVYRGGITIWEFGLIQSASRPVRHAVPLSAAPSFLRPIVWLVTR